MLLHRNTLKNMVFNFIINFKYIIFPFLGSLVIFSVFYLRFLRIRVPKNLNAYYIEDDILIDNSIIIYISLMFIIIFVIRIIILLKNHYNNKFKDNAISNKLLKNNIIKKTVNKIIIFYQFIKNCVYEFYLNFTLLICKIFKISNLFENFENICFYLFYNFNAFDAYIIIFKFLPRIIIYIIFLSEIIYFFKLSVFYKALFFLLIPLIHNITIFILSDFANYNAINLEKRLDKKSFNVGTPEEYHDTFLKDPSDWLSQDPQAFYTTVEKYKNVLTFKEYFLRYKLAEKYVYNFWISLIINIILLLGWLYILTYNYIMFIY
jgi:hypothetical protein